MSFRVPDLIVESILRDGLANARRDESVLDDVFSDLTLAFASKKYGDAEIDKIKKIFQNQEVSIVHSFNLTASNLPCISIQLADDREDSSRAHIGDHTQFYDVMFTPEEQAKAIFVSSFQPTSYNPNTGIVKVPDSVNLAQVYANLLFVDQAGVQHVILGGISNETGSKQFIIEKNGEVSLSNGAIIKTSIDHNTYEIKGNVESSQIILGIHTKEALLTKYLYTMVKYIILSRKKDMTIRGFSLTTYNGSDFHRNMDYLGDTVFTRFFNISGVLQHAWRSDKVQLIDSVDIIAKVPKDRLDNDQLERTDQTVQVED